MQVKELLKGLYTVAGDCVVAIDGAPILVVPFVIVGLQLLAVQEPISTFEAVQTIFPLHLELSRVFV